MYVLIQAYYNKDVIISKSHIQIVDEAQKKKKTFILHSVFKIRKKNFAKIIGHVIFSFVVVVFIYRIE